MSQAWLLAPGLSFLYDGASSHHGLSPSPASETEVVNGLYQWKESEAASYLGGLISDHPCCGPHCDLTPGVLPLLCQLP